MFLFLMCLFDQFILKNSVDIECCVALIGTLAQSKTEVFENDLDDDFVRILGILCKCAGAHAQR